MSEAYTGEATPARLTRDEWRRALEKARYLPRFLSRDWAGIPRDILTDLVCDSVELKSSPEVRLIAETRRSMVESGEWVDHPQLGLVPREAMDEIVRWAREE